MDNKIALDNLISARYILSKLALRYFLIDGTLLGIIRENDFISFDQDVDIGVYFEEFTKEKVEDLINEFMKEHFIIEHKFGSFENNLELSFKRNDVKVDLFFYRLVGDKRIFHAFHPDGIITYQYENSILCSLREITFKGNLFYIPFEPEKVLLAKYGDNWRTPDRHWDWAYSPKNIVNPKPIVFTVGCFDTLHEGHINLFNEMKKIAGISSFDSPLFWVFIHDDYTILQNKGRLPIQELEHRSRNLDILKITHSREVNHCDPTPELELFVNRFPGRKMIYVRADDWIDFPGKKYLEEQGIEIRYVKYTENVSSSLIRKDLKTNNQI